MNKHTSGSNIQGYLAEKSRLVNEAMIQGIPEKNVPEILRKAMEYSLMAGGKRLRPILTLAVYEAFNKKSEDILPLALNLELLHTYSLIHDDLPAMDNDDYRRGKLTNHKVFGEAMAILSGDALLTHAFGNMAKNLKQIEDITLDRALQIIDEFAHYAGAAGMVGGQTVDLTAKQDKTTFEELIYIHTHKTGDLIVFAVRLAGLLANANEIQLKRITEYGRKLGLAFQIQDDLLDIIGDSQKLGKKVGSDESNLKVTYPYFKGVDFSKNEVIRLTQEAKDAIKEIAIETDILYDIADYLIFRES